MALLVRIEPENNVNRWYSVSVQPTLIDPWAVVCAWGRRNSRYYRMLVLPAESKQIAEEMAANVLTHKIRRGYYVTSAGN